jgi:hypothetical protein
MNEESGVKKKQKIKGFLEKADIFGVLNSELTFLETFKLTQKQKPNLKRMERFLESIKDAFLSSQNPVMETSKQKQREEQGKRKRRIFRSNSFCVFEWESLNDNNPSGGVFQAIRQEVETELQCFWLRLLHHFYRPQIQKDKYRVTRSQIC